MSHPVAGERRIKFVGTRTGYDVYEVFAHLRDRYIGNVTKVREGCWSAKGRTYGTRRSAAEALRIP